LSDDHSEWKQIWGRVLMAAKTRIPKEQNSLKGQYANYFKVGHNAFEFVIDFGQYFSRNKTAHVHSRIVTGPIYAKSLLETLRRSIERHEKMYGSIDKDEG
jgi:hypothetical protein